MRNHFYITTLSVKLVSVENSIYCSCLLEYPKYLLPDCSGRLHPKIKFPSGAYFYINKTDSAYLELNCSSPWFRPIGRYECVIVQIGLRVWVGHARCIRKFWNLSYLPFCCLHFVCPYKDISKRLKGRFKGGMHVQLLYAISTVRMWYIVCLWRKDLQPLKLHYLLLDAYCSFWLCY